jgi:hypothetical protein
MGQPPEPCRAILGECAKKAARTMETHHRMVRYPGFIRCRLRQAQPDTLYCSGQILTAHHQVCTLLTDAIPNRN